MNRKPVKIIVLVGLSLLLVAAWHVAEARGRKKRKPVLPRPAAAAIRKAYPKATIMEIEREREGIVLYEVELKQKGEEVEVEVTADGQIVSVEKEITKKDLPKAVAITLAKYAGDAKIKEIEREEIYAVVRLVKLKKPRVVYEAEFMQNGREVEIEIAENGKFLGKEVDDDDDDDEKEITLDQVPAAVKATILAEAGKNKIEEIEVETRRGKKIYEAEWKVGGKEIEIKVASDGTLLSRKTEDEDDDDN